MRRHWVFLKLTEKLPSIPEPDNLWKAKATINQKTSSTYYVLSTVLKIQKIKQSLLPRSLHPNAETYKQYQNTKRINISSSHFIYILIMLN